MPEERRYRRDRHRNRDKDKEHDDGKKIILAKKESSTVKATTPESSGTSHSQPKLLLKPKEPAKLERASSQPTSKSVEVTDQSKETDLGATGLSLQTPEVPLMKRPLKLLTSELVFNTEAISSYIQEQSNDFLVVAFVGPQNSGKSTLANLLLQDSQTPPEKNIFQTRSQRHLTQLGQITDGIDIYITKDRVMVLDCAPLLSNPSYKDYILSELDDLKILTFLFNVCNLVVLVQEKYINPNVVRLIHAAEMMKMSNSSTAEDEHLAKLMLVQNKAGQDHLTTAHTQDMKLVYKTIFQNSNINGYLMQSTNEEEEKSVGNVNFITIPDLRDVARVDRNKRIVDNFRMQVLMSRRYATKYSQVTQFSEKMWLQSLAKTWDSQASNYFFKKYGNLKEKFNLLNHVSISDGIKYDKNVYYPDD